MIALLSAFVLLVAAQDNSTVLDTTSTAAATTTTTIAATTTAAVVATTTTGAATTTTTSGALVLDENGLPKVELKVTGASFPQLLLRAWAAKVNETTKGTITYTYPAGGSGKGVTDFLAGVNDFSCSDAPLTAAQYGNATIGGKVVLHLPETLGAVVVAAKFPVNAAGKFWLTPDLVALIFSGKLTRWNDPRILAVNGQSAATFFAGADTPIRVIRRNDSSGTTFAFTDSLRKTAGTVWTTGAQNAPNFGFWANNTIKCNGNAGVSDCLLNTTWGIAYLEAGQAMELGDKVSVARMLDASCVFAEPTASSISAAVTSSFFVPPARSSSWTGVSLAGIEGGNVWPATTLSYSFVNKNQLGRGPRGAALKAFLEWAMSPAAQFIALDVGLVPLSEKFAEDNAIAVRQIEVDDEDLYLKYKALLAPPKRETVVVRSSAGKRGGAVPFVFVALSLMLSWISEAAAAICAGSFLRCPAETKRDAVSFYVYNPLESAQFAPLWAAQRNGAFDQNCVTADFTASTSGAASDVVDKVGDGTYQFGITSMQALLVGVGATQKVAGLAQIAKRSSWMLLAHKTPRAGGIAKADVNLLRGKTVFRSAESTSRPFFRKAGFADRDINYVASGSGDLVAAEFLRVGSNATALEARPHVELAAILSTPKKPGMASSPLWTLDDFHVFRFEDVDTRWPDDVLVVNVAWYNANRDTAVRVLAGLTSAYVYCRSNAISCASASPSDITSRWTRVLAVDKYLDIVFDVETVFGEPRPDTLTAYTKNLLFSSINAPSELSAVFVPTYFDSLDAARRASNITDVRAAEQHISTLLPYCYFPLKEGSAAAPCGTQFDQINFVKPGPTLPFYSYEPATPNVLSGGIIAAIVIGSAAALAIVVGAVLFVYLRGQRSLKEQTRSLEEAKAQLETQLRETKLMTGDALKIVLSAYNAATPETKQAMIDFREKKAWRPEDGEPVEQDLFALKCSVTRLAFGLGGQGGRLVTATIGATLEQTFTLTNTDVQPVQWSVVSVPPNFLYSLAFTPHEGTLAKGETVTVVSRLVPFATKKIRTSISIVAPALDTFIELKVAADVGVGPLLDPSELQLAEVPVSQGAAGAIFEGMWRGQHVAVKQFKNQQQLIADIENKATDTMWAEFMLEVQMLSRLRHKKVVSYVGAVVVPKHMCIVTEWVSLGSLHTAVHAFEVGVGLKAKLVLDAVEAIMYCHANQIIHRDIKPSNVLIESFAPNVAVNAKLADFGSSREESASEETIAVPTKDDDRAATDDYTRGVGTPVYMAPEVLDGGRYTAAADIYSFGLLVYASFLEVSPWYKERRAYDVAKKVKKGLRPPLPAGDTTRLEDDSDEEREETSTLPQPIREVVVSCWQQEIEKRPSAQAVYDTLSDILEHQLPPATAAVLREGSRMPASMFVTSGGGTRRNATQTGSISDGDEDPLTKTRDISGTD